MYILQNSNFFSKIAFVFFHSIIHSASFPTLNVCITQECYETGQEIRDSLNKRIDPCKDMYSYSCNGWMSKTVSPNWESTWDKWQSIDLRVQERIEFILDYPHEKMDDDLKKAQRLYQKCVKDPIKVGDILDITPDWPLFGNKINSKRSWISLMTIAISKYNVYPLFKIDVKQNLFNTSSYALYIEAGDVVLPEIILQHPLKYSKEINEYQKWIKNVTNYLNRNNSNSFTKLIDVQILEMIEFELKLSSLKNLPDKYELITVNDFTKFSRINWMEYLNGFYNNRKRLHQDTLIIINGRNYVSQLVNLLHKTNPRTIANFIGWSVIKDLSKYGDDYLRNLLFKIEKVVLNIKEPTPIERYCVQFVTKYMQNSIMPKYIELFVNLDATNEIKTMLDNIKHQFIAKLKNNDWLSDDTRTMAIEKIRRMKYFIGYPNDEINLMADSPNTRPKHLNTLFYHVEQYVTKQFNKLWSIPLEVWPENLFEVNAYYNTLQNSIVIPVTLMEMPFFSIRRPPVYNYGSLGFLLAHEMSHALDNIGRKLNMNGHLKNWWTEYDIKQFKNKLSCYEKQYDEMGVNGKHTLSENIADNVGLELSFNALTKHHDKNSDILIPYLENMKREQLFFVSFAQLWCEIQNYPNFIMDAEVHAPNRKRVLATLNNNPSFEKAFYCSSKQEKCSLW